MNILKKAYCRAYQTALRVVKPILPYRNPLVLDKTSELPEILKAKGINKVLIVTDQNIRKTGLVDKLAALLENAGIESEIYDSVQPNPILVNVQEATDLYVQSNAKGLIGYGGGSSIDCAKGVGIRIARPNKPLKNMRGVLGVLKPLPFLVAIPTTAGTGSEVTISAVITDSETGDKFAISDFCLTPNVAVLDASNTKTLPKEVVAQTGLDALTHAVESFIGNSADKQSEEDALEAVKLIFENIEAAYKSSDESSRERMLFASFLGGRAFSKSYVGYVHALAHALGGLYGTPHGLANAVMLPRILKLYRPAIDKKLYQLALAAGICQEKDSYDAGAAKFIAAIKALNKRFGIPEYLPEIKRKDITYLADHAEKEANPLYPVPKLLDRFDLECILMEVGGYFER